MQHFYDSFCIPPCCASACMFSAPMTLLHGVEQQKTVSGLQIWSQFELQSERRRALSATSIRARWRTSEAWRKHGSSPPLPIPKWTLHRCCSLRSLNLRCTCLHCLVHALAVLMHRYVSACVHMHYSVHAPGPSSFWPACTYGCICTQGLALPAHTCACLHVLGSTLHGICGPVCAHTFGEHPQVYSAEELAQSRAWTCRHTPQLAAVHYS